MTPDILDLGRRAVACPRWRWRSGMLGVFSDGRTVRVENADCWTSFSAVPHLSDPATRGCLLALVREAWQDAGIAYCYPVADGWHVVARGRVLAWGIIEADALVAALEAAP